MKISNGNGMIIQWNVAGGSGPLDYYLSVPIVSTIDFLGTTAWYPLTPIQLGQEYHWIRIPDLSQN